MKSALITTTINVPNVLVDWAAQLDPSDYVVVAGDHKTPHIDVVKVLETLPCEWRYLHPDHDLGWGIDQVVGYNSVQRRNLALLEALTVDPDYIITVDDDNRPSDDWVGTVDNIFLGRGSSAQFVSTNTGWFDPGSLCAPPVVHRGFPLSQRRVDHRPGTYAPYTEARHSGEKSVAVIASLVLGAADVDAIWRAQYSDQVDAVLDDAVLAPSTWAPFNSQATAFRREVAPAMLMWPGVGRYDDIWASYTTRVVMDLHGWLVRYGEPTVHQVRNPHNIIDDMRAELLGYEYTDSVIEKLRHCAAELDPAAGVVDLVGQIFGSLISSYWLPDQTIRGFATWVADLHRLQRVYGVNFDRRELTA
jgi:hypothetical protein